MPTCNHCGRHAKDSEINAHELNCSKNPVNVVLRDHGVETWDGEQKYCKCVTCGTRDMTTRMVRDAQPTPGDGGAVRAFMCKPCKASQLRRDKMRMADTFDARTV